MSYDFGSWQWRAWQVIDEVHASLSADASFEDRVKALKDAYPFGERRHHPYKMWLRAQRQYLCRYEPPSDTKRFPLSPLERMMRRAGK